MLGSRGFSLLRYIITFAPIWGESGLQGGSSGAASQVRTSVRYSCQWSNEHITHVTGGLDVTEGIFVMVPAKPGRGDGVEEER